MKKSIVAIGISFMLVGATCFAQSKTKKQVIDNYKKSIEDIYQNYPKNQFFFHSRKLDAEKIQKTTCAEAALEVKTFVDNHSKNLLGMKDTLLLNTAEELKTLTTEGVNVVMGAQTKLFNKPKPMDLVNSEMQKMTNVYEKINKSYEKISKEPFTISEKKESKEVLQATLNSLLDLIRFAVREAMSIGMPLQK